MTQSSPKSSLDLCSFIHKPKSANHYKRSYFRESTYRTQVPCDWPGNRTLLGNVNRNGVLPRRWAHESNESNNIHSCIDLECLRQYLSRPMRTATDVAFFVCSNCCSPGVMVDLARRRRRRRPTGSTQSSLGEMILVGSADQLCGSRYQHCQIAHRAWHFGKPCGGREGFSSRPIGNALRATLSLGKLRPLLTRTSINSLLTEMPQPLLKTHLYVRTAY